MEMDLASFVKAESALPYSDYTAVANGATIDSLGYESLTFLILAGTIGAGEVGFKIQHAPDESGVPGTFVDVASDDYIGDIPVITTSNDEAAFKLGYRGKERFVRLVNVETSTWTSATHGAIALLGHAKSIA